MNLNIDPKYNRYSISIILYLLHSNKDYSKLWIEKYPETETAALNFFENTECGCKPTIVSQYSQDRFNADVMTVSFINDNPDCIDLEKFCEKNGSKDVVGHVFSVPLGEGHYKDFIATVREKRFIFNYFNTTIINDRILITFF